MRSLREAFITFRRAPLLSALSVTTIAFSLFAFGLFGLVALNIREALDQLEDRVEIRAFVAEGTPPERWVAATADIGSLSRGAARRARVAGRGAGARAARAR